MTAQPASPGGPAARGVAVAAPAGAASAQAPGRLIDRFGRVHRDLRVSLTDRCNLRCTYCMPPEGIAARDHGEILSYEELAAFARVAAGAGIRKVRITGGEPLVRLGCAEFVGMLSRTSGIDDISRPEGEKRPGGHILTGKYPTVALAQMASGLQQGRQG